MPEAPEFRLPASAEVAFVGREKEVLQLASALPGSSPPPGRPCWLIEGQEGIGKTRLARTFADQATASGVDVRWAYCQKEAPTPLFPWEQVFRSDEGEGSSGGPVNLPRDPGRLPSLVLVEDGERDAMRRPIVTWARAGPLVFVSRESPSLLRQRLPDLPPTTRFVHLSRLEGSAERPSISLDGVGNDLESFLRSSPSGVVAVEGLEFLVTREPFSSVLNLLQLLRDLAEAGGGHVVLFVRSASFEPRQLSFLESLGLVVRSEPTPGGGTPSPGEVGGPLAQMMLRYLARLEREAKGAPQLIVLDDLQWADPGSLQVLEFLVRNARTFPVTFLALSRPPEAAPPASGAGPSALESTLDRLQRTELLQRMSLPPLSEAAARELVARYLGAPLTGPGREELLRWTEGNPYYLLTSTRMLAEEGHLHKVEGGVEADVGASHPSTIPEGIRRVVARRLGLLSGDGRRVLEAAAVLGREFDPRPLLHVLRMSEAQLLRRLRELETVHRFLEPSREAFGKWSFSSAITWETVRSETDLETSRRLAFELAAWFEGDRPDQVEEAARLYHAAARPEPGLLWVREALERSLRGHDPELVERHHAWLQDLLAQAEVPRGRRVEEGCEVLRRMMLRMGATVPAVERMGRVLTGLGEGLPEWVPAQVLLTRCLMGRHPQDVARNFAALRDRVGLAPEGVPAPYQALWASVRFFAYTGDDGSEQIRIALEALALPGVQANPGTEVYLLYQLGWKQLQGGLLQDCRATLERMEAPGPGRPASYAQTLRLAIAAGLAAAEGRLRDATRLADEGYRTSVAIGDMASAAVVRSNAMGTASQVGDWGLVEEYLRDLSQLADRFDLPRARMASSVGRGDLHALYGRWKEARSSYEETRNAIRRSGDREFEITMLVGLANVGLRSGDLEQARVEVQALERSPGFGVAEERPLPPLLRGLVDEAEGSPATSKVAFEKAYAVAREVGLPQLVGRAAALLGRWELEHGDAGRAQVLRAEGEKEFDRSGMSEEARALSRWWPGDAQGVALSRTGAESKRA